MKPILIIPDVHGRTFWKEPCKHIDDFEKIIFLGDYTDPYEKEGITNEEALSVFKEILDLKNNNPDKVILLIGNHDSGYIYSSMISCRHDTKNHNEIAGLFSKNKDNFKLVHVETINGKDFIFSHAGILSDWMYNYISDEFDADLINRLFWDPKAVPYFDIIDKWRGGIGRIASCIWADIRDFVFAEDIRDEELYPNAFQIVGHTQLIDSPLTLNHIKCIDCRKAFILDEKGEIKEYQNN